MAYSNDGDADPPAAFTVPDSSAVVAVTPLTAPVDTTGGTISAKAPTPAAETAATRSSYAVDADGRSNVVEVVAAPDAMVRQVEPSVEYCTR